MALKCGTNTKTYEPTGDGFSSDMQLAIANAALDFSDSLTRVQRRLAEYAAQDCPKKCRPKVVATPDTVKDDMFDVTWQPRQKRWHVRIGLKITRTVTCGKTGAKPKPKKK